MGWIVFNKLIETKYFKKSSKNLSLYLRETALTPIGKLLGPLNTGKVAIGNPR